MMTTEDENAIKFFKETLNGSSNSSFDSFQDFPNASQVHFLVNITRDVPLEYAMPLFGYIMPFLLLVTIIANTLIVVVLAQSHMKSPTNIVLLTMAISDMLTLLFPAPWYFYMYTLGNYVKVLAPKAACYSYHIMIEIMPSFFHTASIWLTLLLATQRYIYVCHITLARTWCTIPRVKKAITFIFILSLVHQSTRFFDRKFEDVYFKWNGEVHTGCQFQSARWVKEYVTEMFYFTSYYTFRIFFVHIGPCVILVVLNVLLFRALKVAKRNREKLFKDNPKSDSKKAKESNSTTWMLIVVVSVFLVVEIPLAVTTLLHVMQNALDLNIVNYEILNTTILFTNFFIVLSYPVNFAIYCGMSRQFRGTFKNLFLFGNLTCRRNDKTRYSLVNGPNPRTSTNETNL